MVNDLTPKDLAMWPILFTSNSINKKPIPFQYPTDYLVRSVAYFFIAVALCTPNVFNLRNEYCGILGWEMVSVFLWPLSSDFPPSGNRKLISSFTSLEVIFFSAVVQRPLLKMYNIHRNRNTKTDSILLAMRINRTSRSACWLWNGIYNHRIEQHICRGGFGLGDNIICEATKNKRLPDTLGNWCCKCCRSGDQILQQPRTI